MITLTDIKNFLTENLGYVLLGVSSVGVLGVSIYYVFFNEQPEPVVVDHNQNETLKKGNQTKKQKPKKVVLDPVVDNIYWSIASFAVYYSVYLGLRYSDYKEQAVWVIPALVVLGKLGLITFSSFYYQKNSFLQNLNKSINPAYFIHQDIYQIILSLVGYLGLVALIYFDWKKPEQQPIGGGQLPEGQQPIVGGEQPIEQPGGPKPGEIPELLPKEMPIPILQPKINNQNEEDKKIEEEKNNNTIPNLQNHNQNEEDKKEEEKKEEEKKENNEQLLGPKIINDENNNKKAFIQQLFKRTFETDPYKKITDLFKEKGILDFKQVVESIGQSYQDGKISENVINNFLINKSCLSNINKTYYNSVDYDRNFINFPLIDCFFFCFNIHFDYEKDFQCKISQNMANEFLKPLMDNDLNDQKIISLQEAINEIFYFADHVIWLANNIFAKFYCFESSLPADINKIKKAHLEFLDGLIRKYHLENVLLQQTGVNINNHQDGDIEKIYHFLTNKENDNIIKPNEDDFDEIFFFNF